MTTCSTWLPLRFLHVQWCTIMSPMQSSIYLDNGSDFDSDFNKNSQHRPSFLKATKDDTTFKFSEFISVNMFWVLPFPMTDLLLFIFSNLPTKRFNKWQITWKQVEDYVLNNSIMPVVMPLWWECNPRTVYKAIPEHRGSSTVITIYQKSKTGQGAQPVYCRTHVAH